MTDSNDSHDLERFVEAQDPVTEQVKEELLSGRKWTHWMWFVFPQVAGFGKSTALCNFVTKEAEAYLSHPMLGPRLRECTEIVNSLESHTADEIFGSPDDLKFRSSMTLFDAITDGTTPFRTALKRCHDNQPDRRTLQFLTEE